MRSEGSSLHKQGSPVLSVAASRSPRCGKSVCHGAIGAVASQYSCVARLFAKKSWPPLQASAAIRSRRALTPGLSRKSSLPGTIHCPTAGNDWSRNLPVHRRTGAGHFQMGRPPGTANPPHLSGRPPADVISTRSRAVKNRLRRETSERP
jgi:hypothetical protein